MHFTLRQVARYFDVAELTPNEAHVPSEGGERRGLVEKYYANIDFSKWTDVRRLVAVYEAILLDLADGKGYFDAPSAQAVLDGLVKWLRRDGFDFVEGRIVSVGADVPGVEQLADVATKFDAVHLREQIERIQRTVESDPRLAIGTAKELIETTCKTILRERNEPADDAWNVSQLVKATRAALKLTEDDIPGHAPAAETVKRLLSGLSSIAQGLAELRNAYGTGHGADGRARGLGPRHARLAVGAATTLCVFLFQTHEERPRP